MQTLFLLRFGEITLKTPPVRKKMLQRLISNLKDICRRRSVPLLVERKWSRLLISTTQPDAMTEILSHLYGITSFSQVQRIKYTDLDQLIDFAEQTFAPLVPNQHFAVRSRREKQTPISTQKLAIELGTRLVKHGGIVNLTNPALTCSIELRDGDAFLYAQKQPAPGGLPLGIETPVLSLISGGFDSPVASWMIMRRGAPCHYLFFELGGFTQRGAIYSHLHHLYSQWCFGHRPRLTIIPGRPIVEAIQQHIPQKYWNVMLKRTFYQVGSLIAKQFDLPALVTGECIAQVSSQTILNLHAIQHQIDFPIFRPLLTFEKDDIIAKSREVGTHDISAKVQEYCAITPSQASTRCSSQRVLEFEELLGGQSFYQLLISQKETLKVERLNPTMLDYLNVITDTVPKNTTLLDMRETHQPPFPVPTLQLNLEQLLTQPEQLDPSKSYLLFCDGGMQSAEAAHILRELGLDASAFEGGFHRLVKHFNTPPPNHTQP